MEIVTFAFVTLVASIAAAATFVSVSHDGYHRSRTRRP
jgi:hypothetical protein